MCGNKFNQRFQQDFLFVALHGQNPCAIMFCVLNVLTFGSS